MAEQGVLRQVCVGVQQLDGLLRLPKTPIGLFIFAHGSGSSRRSPPNAFVAGELRQSGFATLLLDLLPPAESQIRTNVFDNPLLADRVGEAIGMHCLNFGQLSDEDVMSPLAAENSDLSVAARSG